MEYNKSEVLDLSLPRKRSSATLSLSPQDEHQSEDEIASPTPKKQKQSISPSFTLTSNPSTGSSQSPEHHYSDEIVSIPDDNVTSHSLMKRTCGNVSVCLHDERLWREFLSYGTEMIINRSGRRMFPHVVLTVQGLDPEAYYSVIMEIVPADARRYKYVHNQWMAIGAEDPGRDIQPVTNLDSSSTGLHWMRNRISFSKVRLTNSKESSVKENTDGNVLLLSMHKYMVVIKIRKDGQDVIDDEMKFVFHESAFFAVTAYQNNKITQLKIQNNPFAKAFRDAPCPSTIESQRSSSKCRRVKDDSPDSKSKMTPCGQSYPSLGDSTGFPHPVLNFPAGMFGSLHHMAAFDQIYKAALERRTLPGAPYFPWYGMGTHYPYPFWHKESNHIPQPLSIVDSSTMRLPVEVSQSPSSCHSDIKQSENTRSNNNSPSLDEQQPQSVK